MVNHMFIRCKQKSILQYSLKQLHAKVFSAAKMYAKQLCIGLEILYINESNALYVSFHVLKDHIL